MLVAALLVTQTLAKEPAVTIRFPTLGSVECRGRSWPGTDRPAEVTCIGKAKALLVKMTVDGEYIRLVALQESPLGVPLVVAVAAAPGGSDSSITTAILAERGGRLVDLWPAHWLTNETDAVCIGEIAPGQPGVFGLTYLWGDGTGESHYAPHVYRLTRYMWKDGRLVAVEPRVTRGRVVGWREAATELQHTCTRPYGGREGFDALE
jgi:hypothetical protein